MGCVNLIWQDVVITSGSVVFALALLPQLRDCYHGACINFYSAFLTAFILGIFCITYASLGLWMAAIPITVVVWGLIGYFSWRNKHGDLNKDTPCIGD
jgi:predicted membrane protein